MQSRLDGLFSQFIQPLLLTVLFSLSAAPSVRALPEDYTQKVTRILETVDQGIAQGPFQADWDSLRGYEVPEWYRGGKFGIFIHWGVYSVPAFENEWYPRNMYVQGSRAFKHHLEKWGPQAKFGYKDFIPMFKAEHFDPAQWARLFRESGARFVVPVAEHHDGFPMYDCSLTEWSAATMGPKRDIVGELAKSVREQGLVFGVSTHRAEHWWFFDAGKKFDSDVNDPRYDGVYGPAQPQKTSDGKESQPNRAHLDDWLARTAELADRYEPQLIWFDWWIEQPAFEPYLKRFAAFYYNHGVAANRGVAINYKHQAFPEGVAVWDIERGQAADIRPYFWQTDTSVCKKSWGYINDHDYKSADSLVDDLVDIVSKNGALLLNIGPRPDGTIPAEQESLLREIGQWLRVNGEAIYGTRPWKVFGEGPTQVVAGSFKDTARTTFSSEDLRFTSKGDTLFAIALAWPENGEVRIKSLHRGAVPTIRDVALLGAAEKPEWKWEEDALTVRFPADRPCDYAFALRISTGKE